LGIPEYIDIEAWDGFCEMRKMKGSRAPFTPLAKKLILRKLEDFYRQGYEVNTILETSIVNGWTDVYLRHDTPRRQMTPVDKANQAKVMALVAKVGK
jgi:hypothetical protein